MATQLDLDDETGTVLADLVRQTGRDQANIVREALRDKQERLLNEQHAAYRLTELKEILRRLTPPPGERRYMSHSEGDAWLYDEHGLPH